MHIYQKICCIISICITLSCSASGKNALVFPGDNWQSATPQSQGIDPTGFHQAIEYLHTHANGVGTNETVIIKNGYLIYQGHDANNIHEIYSCTKTFTSTVLGLLVTDGTLSVDDYAVKYLPSLDDKYPEYSHIKLSQLATMTSGYNSINGDGWSFYRTDRNKHYQYVLSYTTPGPPMFPAGKSFKYHDPAVHMLGYILTKTAGKSLQEIFTERIATPIGIKHFTWSDYGYRDGILFNNPAGTPDINQGGVYSNALDIARYGLLYLNKGNWNGRQILAPSFVERATSTQVPSDIKTKYMDLTGRYGFYWWTNGIKADGTRPWPSAPPKTFAAHGGGRNFIFVIPEWNMVIVRLCPAPDGQIHLNAMKEETWQNFFSRLKPAIKDAN